MCVYIYINHTYARDQHDQKQSTIESVCYRMCSLTTECVLSLKVRGDLNDQKEMNQRERDDLLAIIREQGVCRMCSLTIECVLSL